MEDAGAVERFGIVAGAGEGEVVCTLLGVARFHSRSRGGIRGRRDWWRGGKVVGDGSGCTVARVCWPLDCFGRRAL